MQETEFLAFKALKCREGHPLQNLWCRLNEKGDPRSPNKWSRVSRIEYYDYIRDTIYYHQFFRPQKLYNTTRLFTRRPCSWFVPLEYRRLEATPRSATEQIQYQLFIFSQTLLSHYMTHPMSSAHAS